MKRQSKFISVLVVLPLLFLSGRPAPLKVKNPDAAAQQRIRFQIAIVEENAGGRSVISTASIEGPPGTDFSINLVDSRFKMDARFLTDLLADASLNVRAKLQTRRLYGYSERNLPLYEEDVQNHTLPLSFDEQIVLLPFGRGGSDSFQIEIVPAVSENPAYLPSGELTPPEIKIDDQTLRGLITIQACKIPHRFQAEATLLEDGREIARGMTSLLLEEPREIALEPLSDPPSEIGDRPTALSLAISDFVQSRPADRATVTFDLFGPDKLDAGKRTLIASRWAGVTSFGSPLTYDLSRVVSGSSVKKYELRLAVRPTDK